MQRQAELRADAGFSESAEDVAAWRGLSYPEKEAAIAAYEPNQVGQSNTGPLSGITNALNIGANPATSAAGSGLPNAALSSDVLTSGQNRGEVNAQHQAQAAATGAHADQSAQEHNKHTRIRFRQLMSNSLRIASKGLVLRGQ